MEGPWYPRGTRDHVAMVDFFAQVDFTVLGIEPLNGEALSDLVDRVGSFLPISK